MVIVKISGGLGNQIFQYAFGQYVSKSLNVIVKYDIQTKIDISSFTERELGLMNYDFDIIIANNNEIKSVKCFLTGIFCRLERKTALMLPFLTPHFIVESKLHKTLLISDLKDNCYYDGYWQSFKYLEINKETLRDSICLSKFNIGNETFIDEISFSNSVSLHIRRGDYVSIKKNNEIYHICGLDYYHEAIKQVEKSISNPRYYVFSDDIEWVKQNFLGNQFVFVEGNSPYVDMYIMSQCKHHIIANSTFSWWGAWLNNKINKIIIAPAKWYKNDVDNILPTFIPNDWIRL